MARAKTTKPVAKKAPADLELRITATIMSCREHIMQYFKGTCVERLTAGSNVSRDMVGMPRLQYQYMREDVRVREPQLLLIGSLPIAVLRKIPDSLTFNTKVLDLSPGLKLVEVELRKFLQQYLGGIEVRNNATLQLDERNTINMPKAVDDNKLFTALPADSQEPDPYAAILEHMRLTTRPAQDLVFTYNGVYADRGPTIVWDEVQF